MRLQKQMWKRLLILIKSWFGIEPNKSENYGVLIDQALQEMKYIHSRNRERAEQAIAQKDTLQKLVDDLKERTDRLKGADRQRGKAQFSEAKASLEEAIRLAETIQKHIEREQEEIRRKTAEALVLKSQWKSASSAGKQSAGKQDEE